MHQPDHLSQLFLNWVFSSPSELLHPPIQQISGYFGLEICLYFAWLAHYTKCLIAPALIGRLIKYTESYLDFTNMYIFPWTKLNKMQSPQLCKVLGVLWFRLKPFSNSVSGSGANTINHTQTVPQQLINQNLKNVFNCDICINNTYLLRVYLQAS